ncbi:hypothetical protein CWI38_1837p0010 [Hamiltosporidium tvaerminnensis]|uniref:Uncharacterized protein n=1 Tax=Hamiltosporidium tvaerminnensis TaxID=1176355 RepID=A0A4Q9LRQ0_9MICR|nr:hypothetical protein CWI38_1899p0010 [Hamiltosporidium tvaerminnensis]TBU10341.1 hypothetical protein CWI38_1837p0010 [Hamiltosporidium tvaerminnensis]
MAFYTKTIQIPIQIHPADLKRPEISINNTLMDCHLKYSYKLQGVLVSFTLLSFSKTGEMPYGTPFVKLLCRIQCLVFQPEIGEILDFCDGFSYGIFKIMCDGNTNGKCIVEYVIKGNDDTILIKGKYLE